MKPNTNYGMRPVKPEEIATVCGTARRAVEVTGGDETIALFYIHNADLVPLAPPAKSISLSDFGASLRALRDEQEESQRRTERKALIAEMKRKATEAWTEKHTYTAVMRACGVGRDKARRLVGGAP